MGHVAGYGTVFICDSLWLYIHRDYLMFFACVPFW